MNNHQNAIFRQLDNFIKHSHSFAMTIFHKITKSAKLVIYAATKEKCYGVVKAGQNDCATKTSSCAGSSNADGQKDAFIALPKGLCDKLDLF
jgi:uncharacterized membrane protein